MAWGVTVSTCAPAATFAVVTAGAVIAWSFTPVIVPPTGFVAPVLQGVWIVNFQRLSARLAQTSETVWGLPRASKIWISAGAKAGVGLTVELAGRLPTKSTSVVADGWSTNWVIWIGASEAVLGAPVVWSTGQPSR